MHMTRGDGRQPDELRPVRIQRSYLDTVPGAALITVGRTQVLCTVAVEDRVPPFLVGTGKGWLTAEYGMLPGCSPQRVARESSTGKVNGRTREIQRLIGRSLRAAVDLDRLGERTLWVDCDVIRADGGTRTAAITGAFVALAEATANLMAQGRWSVSPLIRSVAAVSVGLVDGVPLLDLCYEEDARAATDLNVVAGDADGLVEVQGTAEGQPFSRAELGTLLDLAGQGLESLRRAQLQTLQDIVWK